MRTRSILSRIVSAALVVVGLALVAVFAFNFFGPGPGAAATNEPEPSGFNVPEVQTSQQSRQPDAGPEDKTLKVTIPAMSRIEDDTVSDAAGDDEQALRENAAIHLRGTGFPWQDGANTYLAGHRLGYPGTDSFLAFYDLNKLENGDEVFVEDSEGAEYTYRVYKSFVTGPSDLSVTEPVAGESVLTLQTCTLPDYSERLIVQAELVESSGG